MFRFSQLPNSVLDIFTSLCLSQVKEQLTENLTYFSPNPESFIYDDQLFVFSPIQTFIEDEPHPGYNLNLRFDICYN